MIDAYARLVTWHWQQSAPPFQLIRWADGFTFARFHLEKLALHKNSLQTKNNGAAILNVQSSEEEQEYLSMFILSQCCHKHFKLGLITGLQFRW